jgi:hypothetical protein
MHRSEIQRLAFTALWVVGGLAGFAKAQAQDQVAPPDASEDSGWRITVQVENEFFIPGVNDDRYYTQGLQLHALSPLGHTPVADRTHKLPFFLESGVPYRGGFAIGQNIYTPEDLTLSEPDPRDRPYAGWLYIGGEVLTYSDKELNSLQLQVGLVGPSALGGWTQNNWHKHVSHIAEAQGWNYQLKDEVAFVLYGERRGRPTELWPVRGHANRTPGLSIDATPELNLALGTVQTSAALGGMLRIGNRLGEDFGPPRIRPAPSGSAYFASAAGASGYAFAGFEVKGVVRDIFLDGNTFQDSRRVDKRPLVAELQAGLVGHFGPFRVTYTHVWRTDEFYGQNGGAHFAALSIGWSPGVPLTRKRIADGPEPD